MKKGYFQNIGRPGLPQPQKVLPPVDPNHAAKLLKATSNGAILHGGGTISGRKLLGEDPEAVACRKRSTASCPGISHSNGGENVFMMSCPGSGFSTPDIYRMSCAQENDQRPCFPGGRTPCKYSRDYDSEPELLREEGGSNSDQRRSVSPPLPNSFTLLSESPAKKQIRSKKKTKAPPPPNAPVVANTAIYNHHNAGIMMQNSPAVSHAGSESRKNRLFKTKAESKIAIAEKSSVGQQQQRAFSRSEKSRELISDKAEWKQNNSNKDSSDILKMSEKNKLNAKSSRGGQKSEIQERTTASSSENVVKKSKSVAPGPPQNPVEETPRKRIIMGTNDIKLPDGGNPKKQTVPKVDKPCVESGSPKREKKTFYFGMDMGTFTQSAADGVQVKKSESDKLGQRSKALGLGSSKKAQTVETNGTANCHLSSHGDKASSGTAATEHVLSDTNKLRNQTAFSHSANKSESDSDGIHRRQDSGSFDIKANHCSENGGKSNGSHKQPEKIRESSSDLSSSEVDIPLMLKPTLPQKRLELPRFSPGAAWRAIDSPRASEQSISSDEPVVIVTETTNFTQIDEDSIIHGHSRRTAPLRSNPERSGDSGISAGDGASPASNELLLEENCRKKSPNKCWTPEQDLDESSSDFEPEILAPVSPAKFSTRIPVGLRTPPKFTTRSNLFEKRLGSSSTSNENTLSGRRSKTLIVDYSSSGEEYEEEESNVKCIRSSRKKSNGYWSSGGPMFTTKASHWKFSSSGNSKKKNHHVQHPLDSNWFLSRSEPNSLNLLHLTEFKESPGEANNSNGCEERYKKWRKKSTSAFREDEHSSNFLPNQSTSHNDNNRWPSNNEHEQENFGRSRMNEQRYHHYLYDEQEDCTTTAKAHKGGSEIGYGPSSMNFYSGSNLKGGKRIHDYRRGVSQLNNAEHWDDDNNNENQGDLLDHDRNNNNDHGRNNRKLSSEGSTAQLARIMYLPSYDSRRLMSNVSNGLNQSRRAKSVDQLDSSEFRLFRGLQDSDSFSSDQSPLVERKSKCNRESEYHQRSYTPDEGAMSRKYGDNGAQGENQWRLRMPGFTKSQSVPLYAEEQSGSGVIVNKHDNSEENTPRNISNKRKFKFQSTLRILERKKIEAELTREAKEREEQRLREIEKQKRVEEEFQKKRRAKEENDRKLEIHQRESSPLGIGFQNVLLKNRSKSQSGSQFDNTNVLMSQRQEPEGAPANNAHNTTGSSGGSSSQRSTTTDLRKELIHASKKRNGIPWSTNFSSASNNNINSNECAGRSSSSCESTSAASSSNMMINNSNSSNMDRVGKFNKHGVSVIAVGGQSSSNEMATQELSEFRQPDTNRKYCDYRRPARHQSSSPAR